jgi:hypothetical protein
MRDACCVFFAATFCRFGQILSTRKRTADSPPRRRHLVAANGVNQRLEVLANSERNGALTDIMSAG